MLLFGAKKLPELARGSGRALRIFKSETKGVMDDDDDDDNRAQTATTQGQITSPPTRVEPTDPSAPVDAQTTDALPPTHTEK